MDHLGVEVLKAVPGHKIHDGFWLKGIFLGQSVHRLTNAGILRVDDGICLGDGQVQPLIRQQASGGKGNAHQGEQHRQPQAQHHAQAVRKGTGHAGNAGFHGMTTTFRATCINGSSFGR